MQHRRDSGRAVSAITCLILLLLGAGEAELRAQPSSWQAKVSAEALASSGSALPFWLRANQYGAVDSTSANALLRMSLARSFALSSSIDAEVGGELLARASSQSTVHAHELYGRLKYRSFWLQAGRWEERPTGLAHPTLSLGSMGRSRNAPPLPKVALGTSSYLPVPGTDETLAAKGYMAHGWFPEDRYVSNAYLHEKYAYLRIFPRHSPLQLHAGILQHTIWGGTHPTLGQMPQDLGTLLRVLGGQSGGETAPERDQKGTIGASEAGYDFAVAVQRDGWEAQISRYFHHTDRPSLLFRNPWDGLWEIRLERSDPDHLVTTVLWEHLNATRHNAKYSEGEERGQDSYYNNGHYRAGWTHRGFTLGSPLLLENPNGPGVSNNIVVAHHLGLQGRLAPSFDYSVLVTYSRHYGGQYVCAAASCSQRVDRRTDRTDQYSTVLELTGRFDPVTARAAVSTDFGALYENRVGLSVGLTWSLSSPRP